VEGPRTTAPPSFTRASLTPTSKFPLTLTGPGGDTGTKALTPELACREIGKLLPSRAWVLLKATLKFVFHPHGAIGLETEITADARGAGQIYLGRVDQGRQGLLHPSHIRAGGRGDEGAVDHTADEKGE